MGKARFCNLARATRAALRPFAPAVEKLPHILTPNEFPMKHSVRIGFGPSSHVLTRPHAASRLAFCFVSTRTLSAFTFRVMRYRIPLR